MRLVKKTKDGREVVAPDARLANSLWAKSRGLMLRRDVPGDALVFRFEDRSPKPIHMIGVPFHVTAIWLVGQHVIRTKTMRPIVGGSISTGNVLVEMRPERAKGIEAGDKLKLEDYYETRKHE